MSNIKAIYAGLRACGFDPQDEDTKRDLFERVTNKRSLRLMNDTEQQAVAAELRRLRGNKPLARKKLQGPFAKKLQALWIASWNLGLVQSRDDKALVAFVTRQTGVEDTAFLRDPKAAEKVVEALKDMLRREGVMLGNTNGHSWLRDDAAKVAWAQWKKLYPVSDLRDLTAFRARIAAMSGKSTLDFVERADWQRINNAFGVIIRKGAA